MTVRQHTNMALNRFHPQNENFVMTSARSREASAAQLKSYMRQLSQQTRCKLNFALVMYRISAGAGVHKKEMHCITAFERTKISANETTKQLQESPTAGCKQNRKGFLVNHTTS